VPVRATEPPVHQVGGRVQVHFQPHREKARRRLRSQVNTLELLIAKIPVPPNPRVLGAPSASIKDVMRRCKQNSDATRYSSEQGFQKLLQAWNAARKKHMTALRPQLGSPDARVELDKLKNKELKRSKEVREAVVKFKTRLLEMETTNAKETVLRMISVTKCNAMIVDKMVLKDDFISLPGDELILPKRKSLKRLRKASQAAAAREEDGVEAEETGANTGRKFSKRTWGAFNLNEMKEQMLIDVPAPPELSEEEKAEKAEEEAKILKNAGKKGSSKSVANEEELEGGREETGNVVEDWVRAMEGDSVFESFVTTAHRCLVKTVEEEVAGYSAFFRKNVEGIRRKYEGIYEKECGWEGKWVNLVEDLCRETAQE